MISKTRYDSFAEGNTNGITDEINKYINSIGYIFAIVTCDAISHDSTFNDLMKSFDLGKNISCDRVRNSFAFLGVSSHSQNTYKGYEHDCNFDYNVSENSTLTSSIIKKSSSDKPIVLTRNLKMYTRIYPYNDSTQPIGIPYATHNTAVSKKTIPLKNATLYAGRTYHVKVRFRTRGDGNSTPSKCSSIGFITFWNNWANLRRYIHNSATAYSEIGKVVEWTYSFTVNSDVTPTDTSLYFIIDNYWPNGNDAQTIDLYYAKYWDSEGNVYSELGTDMIFLKLKKDNLIYYAPNLDEENSHSVIDAEGKIFFKKSDSNMLYALRDTLEKYTYAELEHLKFLNRNYKFVNLDYMELYNY